MNSIYKLCISYDGTRYHGWQVQPHACTVAGTLESTFTATFGTTIRMVGASRTDSGVHARGQVARVITPLSIAPEKLLHAWNNALPNDIVITQLSKASDHFHPHQGVVHKLYQYTIFLHRPSPFQARFGWWPHLYLAHFDPVQFEKALQVFVGTHDFTAFSRNEPGRNPLRSIDTISVCYNKPTQAIIVTIQGKGFLRFQIRRMIGAAVMVASRTTVSCQTLEHLLAHPEERSDLLVKAEAHGLCLDTIVYEKEA